MKKPLVKAMSGVLSAALLFSSLPGVSAAAIEKGPKTETALKEMLQKFQTKRANPSLQSKEKGQAFDEKTLLIKYKTPISALAHQKAGGKLIQRVAGLGYDIVQANGKTTLEQAAKNYAKLPNVASVSKSAMVKRYGTDLKASSMYHLKTLKADAAAKLAGKNKVRVAVVDGGVDSKHPELKNKLVSSSNVLNPAQRGLADEHGTHVAGIIAAEKGNNTGGYGINPNVDLISVDVFNRSMFTNDYVIAQGILKAVEQKAQVINLSLGTEFPSPIVEEAVKKAIDSNIAVVAAAGNSGNSTLSYPASFDGVISVGSTNSKDTLSGFSSFGPSVDVVAPGEDIYSTLYDAEKGSSFGKMSGTSMASPAVAGVVSLMLSKNPKLTPYQINFILNETARDLGSKGYDLKYGHGLIDPIAALNFDVKKIPSDPTLKENQMLAAAKAVTGEKVTGSFKKMNQTDYYKVEVKKGDNVQLKLKEQMDYDQVLGLHFYKGTDTKPSYNKIINDQRMNGTEGTLFEAKEDGVLVLSVKDAFGNYNTSGSLSYELLVDKRAQKPEDGNTKETPELIGALPYQSDKPLYFTDEISSAPAGSPEIPVLNGDSDFFSFKTGELQPGEMMKLAVSDVPGIDSSLKLYMVVDEEGKKVPMEFGHMDTQMIGYGESYVFIPNSNTEYVFEVSNKPSLEEWQWRLRNKLDFDRSFSSMIPYTVSLESKILPADEDNLPAQEDLPSEKLKTGDIAAFNEAREALDDRMAGTLPEDPYEKYINTILNGALPFEMGSKKTGYLQFEGDEDWFAFTPAEQAIIEFDFVSGKGNSVPLMELYTYDETLKDLVLIGDNSSFSWDGFSTLDVYKAGLKKGQKYFLKMYDAFGEGSLQPYEFSAKVLVANTADRYEDNDKYENAVRFTGSKVSGNFSSLNDLDMFYFKPSKQGLFGWSLKPAPEKTPANMPADLKAPIDPVLVTIEDSNGNGKMEPEEEGKFIVSDYTFDNEPETGAIDAKTGKGYFVVAFNYYSNMATVTPYDLSIEKIGGTDEDKGSVKKNNVPTKPAALNKGTAKGYYHSPADSDTYKLVLARDSKLTATLETPFGTDGKVTVHNAAGKQIWTADQYGLNDAEIFNMNLKKGTYYITVEESADRVSTSPYELTIK